jgi:hypothetical protein
MGTNEQRTKETLQKPLSIVHDDNSTANLAGPVWQSNEPESNLHWQSNIYSCINNTTA